MKNKSTRPPVRPEPSDEDIRDYAYHLYQQSSCGPGHDLDNWLEATACLKANIPAHRSGTRLHRHVNRPESGELHALSPEARNLAWMPDPLARETVPNPFGGRNSILNVARSPEAAHLADAEYLPMKNTNKQKTRKI